MSSQVAVIGLGYVGLPTALSLAMNDVEVLGIDTSKERVQTINTGQFRSDEPRLNEALDAALANGKFRAAAALEPCDAYIIAVPTPLDSNRRLDDSYIRAAVESIAQVAETGSLIILESTSPPGTTRKIAEWVRELRPDLCGDAADYSDWEVLFAHCPERVLPGNALEEIRENDRIVGGINALATARARQLYETFCVGEIESTDDLTAELTKLVENTFRDVNIAFANELSMVCDRLGADVWEVISLANNHPRVNILQPGPGVGGHCIAVDPWFLVASDPHTPLIQAARGVNDLKPLWVSERIERVAATVPESPIALLGLTFKADIDDLRESPAVEIVMRVAEMLPDRQILVVEPHIAQLPGSLARFDNLSFSDLTTALEAASVVGLLVDHQDFRRIDCRILSTKQVVDTRGIWR